MAPEEANRKQNIMNRREALVAAGALASLAAVGPVAAKEAHDHSKHAPRGSVLLEELERCDLSGRLCLSHCFVSFSEGDTSLAQCAVKVHEMMAVCRAMSTLVASDSTYVRGMARVCIDACRDCAAECEKHAKMHRECGDCAEACEAVIPSLKKLAA